MFSVTVVYYGCEFVDEVVWVVSSVQLFPEVVHCDDVCFVCGVCSYVPYALSFEDGFEDWLGSLRCSGGTGID